MSNEAFALHWTSHLLLSTDQKLRKIASIVRALFLRCAVSILVVFLWTTAVSGQTVNLAKITITSVRPPVAHVVLELKSPQTSLSFRNTVGSALGLAERIENVSTFTGNLNVTTIRNAAGQYRASNAFTRVEYDVALSPPARQADRSHVSWLTHEHGILMLADLLPELTVGAMALQLELVPPPSWAIASGIKSSAGTYLVSVPDKAVFMIGPSLRLNTRAVAGGKLLLASSGKWPFADSEVMNTAGRVVDECARVTGTVIPSDSVLMLLPSNGAAFTWTAETRGNAIVVLLNRAEPKRQLLARLGVILTHEAFHLWVPNALHFDGDYDWFFEGFTLYQALLTALRLRLIDFDEYLNTLARVYDSYLLAEERDRWSLLELSQRRWTSTSSLVYNKGMLVAMIYDLHLRQLSGGKRGLPSLYPQLLKAGDSRGDANEVIISLLDRPAGMNYFSSTYVSKAQALDFPALLSPYGITSTRSGFETKLSVKKPLERTQEAVLKSLRFKG